MTKPINRNPYDLPRWERPDNYMGESPDGDFVVHSKTRDSDLLCNTNFDCIEEELRALDEQEEFVYTLSAAHWGCGWVEHLLLRFDSPDELQARVYEIHAALSDYPIYDDSAYSREVTMAMEDYWERMCTSRRIELCAEYGVPIFACRRKDIPEPIYEQVRAWVEE